MIGMLLAVMLAVVQNPNPSVSYACDGSTAAYTVNFPYLAYTDLVVTSTTVAGSATTLVYTTDYTVNLTSTSSTATLTLNSPSTKCPTGNTLKIARTLALTQPTSFKAQTTYNQTLHEQAYDRQEMQIQQINDRVTNPVIGTTSVQASNPNSNTSIQLQLWFAFVANAQSYGAKADGTDTSAAINSALSNNSGIVYLPSSALCYNIGATTINIGSGRTLQGGGLGQTQGPTCITYTGTGCAIMLDSAQFSAVRDLDLTINTASATAAGICMQGTSAVAEFNEISGVSIRQTNATRRVAGQVGLQLKDNGQGVYWNSFKRLRFSFWDNAIKLIGGASGANANRFEDIMSWGHVTAFHTTVTQVTNNSVLGLHCSRSDGSFVGTANCVVLGDDGSSSSFNKLYFTADQGAPAVCFTAGAGAGGNIVEADCQSGGAAFTGDTNVTAFPNSIYDTVNAATPSLLHLGRLAVKNEISMGAAPATAGDIRMSNNQIITARNAANTVDLTIAKMDTNDRLMLGTSAAFARLNNQIIEFGTGVVSNSGVMRAAHATNFLGRNSGNSANRTIFDWGVGTADTLVVGDANMTAVTQPGPTKLTNTVNRGSCTLGTNCATITVLSGAICTCADTTAANACRVSVSGTTLTLTGTGTDVLNYTCL